MHAPQPKQTERKSGIPAETLMPAPVRTTMRFNSPDAILAARDDRVTRGGAAAGPRGRSGWTITAAGAAAVTFLLPLLPLSATLRPANFSAVSSSCASVAAAELLVEADCTLLSSFDAVSAVAAVAACDVLLVEAKCALLSASFDAVAAVAAVGCDMLDGVG